MQKEKKEKVGRCATILDVWRWVSVAVAGKMLGENNRVFIH